MCVVVTKVYLCQRKEGFHAVKQKPPVAKKILEMITMTTEEIKRLQDFDQNETTALEKRKQFRETTKSWKEAAILQKTGMKYS